MLCPIYMKCWCFMEEVLLRQWHGNEVYQGIMGRSWRHLWPRWVWKMALLQRYVSQEWREVQTSSVGWYKLKVSTCIVSRIISLPRIVVVILTAWKSPKNLKISRKCEICFFSQIRSHTKGCFTLYIVFPLRFSAFTWNFCCPYTPLRCQVKQMVLQMSHNSGITGLKHLMRLQVMHCSV